jgi:Acyl-CoA dehydrogenase, C-terminal domain
VMAMVPKSEGHRGGITAFIVPCDTPGITVAHRNAFMGLRGIENSVTTFDNVVIPAANVIGGEGIGLKIALTTLNTGRLSLPAICASVSKYCLKIVREWGTERVQWGIPVGRHDAVAQRIASIAGTSFGLEAVLDVSSRMADEHRNDIRIEAALAKLYGSEMAWLAVDDMMQVRGGRGYETAESLKARGEKPVPAEQLMRDMRINRIFEGSSEIMHLLIAREAVDEHLQRAGDIIEPDVPLGGKARTAAKAGGFYATWLPKLAAGKGTNPRSYNDFGDLAEHLRFVERNSRKLARSTFYGMSRWQGKLEKKQSFLGRIVDIGAELYAIACACVYAQTLMVEDRANGAQYVELADLFCRQARRRTDRLLHDLWFNDDAANYDAAVNVLDGRYTMFERDIIDPAGEGPMLAPHTSS